MTHFNPAASLLAGMNRAALQTALSNAQQAYLALSTGAQAVDVSFTQGESAEHVTYIQTDLAKLAAVIREIQAQLGIVRTPRQRPMRPMF